MIGKQSPREQLNRCGFSKNTDWRPGHLAVGWVSSLHTFALGSCFLSAAVLPFGSHMNAAEQQSELSQPKQTEQQRYVATEADRIAAIDRVLKIT